MINDIWCVSKWSQPCVGSGVSDQSTEGVVPLSGVSDQSTEGVVPLAGVSDQSTEGVVPLAGGERADPRVAAGVWAVLQFLAQLCLQAAGLAKLDCLTGLNDVLAMPRMFIITGIL